MPKMMMDIKGEMFDLWEFRSVQRGERYNEQREDMDYLICINKNAIQTNYNDLEIPFEDKDERDRIMEEIKSQLDELDTVVFITIN